jgi:hypothetical protein
VVKQWNERPTDDHVEYHVVVEMLLLHPPSPAEQTANDSESANEQAPNSIPPPLGSTRAASGSMGPVSGAAPATTAMTESEIAPSEPAPFSRPRQHAVSAPSRRVSPIPEPTLAPSLTPSVVPSPSPLQPTLTPSATPTLTALPTPTPTAAPSRLPSATLSASPLQPSTTLSATPTASETPTPRATTTPAALPSTTSA